MSQRQRQHDPEERLDTASGGDDGAPDSNAARARALRDASGAIVRNSLSTDSSQFLESNQQQSAE